MYKDSTPKTSSITLRVPDANKWSYVLPIEERYWNRFRRLNRAGKNVHAYVQAGDVLSTKVKLVFFYSIHPFKEILGFADFLGKIAGNPQELWESRGHETCLNSFDEYSDLTRKKARVTFIRFTNFQVASNTLTFDQVSGLLGTERMSQTGMYLNREQSESLVRLLMEPSDSDGISL